MREIVFFGRGGQGAVTAGELLAKAAGKEGKYSQAFPKFGVERRGAPVKSFCRIDGKKIRVHQEVYKADILVVLDSTLMKNVTKEEMENCKMIVNSKKQIEGVFTVDATEIALKHVGRPVVNTAMLGALVKVSDVVKLETLKEIIREHFDKELGEENVKAVEECYKSVKNKQNN